MKTRHGDAPALALWLYSRLIRVCPPGFLRRHRTEMELLFGEKYGDAAGRPAALARLWIGTVRDVVLSGLAERSREVRPLRGLIDDARYARRVLVHRPSKSVLVIAVVGVGLGASAVGWTLMHDILLRPLPYPDSERLVAIWDRNPEIGLPRSGPSPANMVDWRDRNRSFSGIAALYAGEPRTWIQDGESAKVAVAEVTEDFFSVLAARPVLGRTFSPAELRSGEPVVVVSYRVWVDQLGAANAILGSTVVLDNVPHRIVGVLAEDFAIPDRDTAFWLPWDFDTAFADLGHIPRDYRYLQVIARLLPGISLETAQGDLDRLSAQLAEQHPENRGWSAWALPLKSDIVGDLRPAVLTLFGAVTLVLLIALTNAAHLLIGDLSARGQEVAVRSAMGASAPRLSRQVGLEVAMLSGAGVLLAAVLAVGALQGLAVVAPGAMPRFDEVDFGVDGIGYLAVVGAATSLILWAATGPVLRRGFAATLRLRSSATHVGRWRGGLLIGQATATFVLTALAMLLARSLFALLAVDPGFISADVLVARVFPDPEIYDSTARRLAYFDELRDRLAALPGVESVGAASGLPLNAYNNTPSVQFADADAPSRAGGPEADVYMTTAGFFETLQIPLLQGRRFDAGDEPDAQQVVIVNEQLAAALWADGNAVGRSIRMRLGSDRDFVYEIVGIVAGLRSENLKSAPLPQAFRPHTQSPYVTMNVVIRAARVDAALEAAVRAEVLAIDATQPVHSMLPMSRLLSADVASNRFAMWLVSTLTVVALALASTGIYGVMSHAVRSRIHEIGVRKALGAGRHRIAATIVGHAAAWAAAGVAGGTLLVLASGRVLASILFGVSYSSAGVLVSASVVVTGAILLAAWLPARRAAAVDAAIALRAEA